MHLPGWLRRTSGWVLYPLLGAAYPVVFLYAQNVHQGISAGEVLAPLVVSVAVSGATLAILWAALRDPGRAALITTLLVALFYTYGLAWDQVGSALAGPWVLVAGWIAIASLGSAMIVRFGRAARRLTVPLNAFAVVLLAVNLLTVGAFFLNIRPAAAGGRSGVTAGQQPTGAVTQRDIYWIMLEEYAPQSVLDSAFGYDNSPFLDALRSRGFYIADRATANYLKTAPSLDSSRNMVYLDAAALAKRAHGADDFGPLYKDLTTPFEVERFLGSQGYRFLYLGMYWAQTASHPDAEINYVYDKLGSEFIDVLERATMLRALEGLGPQAPYDWRRNRWNQTSYELDALDRASQLAGPKFVHAQLALDHEPYVFHADGSFVTDAEDRARTHEAAYVEQLKFTNDTMLAWLDQVLAVPEEQRPIIIMQADEGAWPYGYRRNELDFDWTTASPEDLRTKFGILSAFYVPGMLTPQAAGLYDSITPVNQFRALFNAYFGLDLPLLPDRNFIWPNQRDIYNLIDVTDRMAP